MRSHALALTVTVVLIGPGLFAQHTMKERAVFDGQFLLDALVLSPDGKLLASGGRSKPRVCDLKLWDATSGKELATLEGGSNPLSALTFSPDGKLLASGGHGVPVTLWDVAARKHLVSLNGPGESLAFSPDSSRLAAAGSGVVKLWDVKEGKEVSSFQQPFNARRPAFSPDLKTLAWPDYQEIELRDLSTGQEKALLSEHRGSVHALAFSSDNRVLAAASTWSRNSPGPWIFTGQVKLWDVATARERITFKGDFGRVFGLTLSPDGKSLAVLDAGATTDADAELKLLDTVGGREVLRHKCKARWLLAVSFGADGTLFLVESADRKTIKLWELPRRKDGEKVP
jgi:WD40 repeat protein